MVVSSLTTSSHIWQARGARAARVLGRAAAGNIIDSDSRNVDDWWGEPGSTAERGQAGALEGARQPDTHASSGGSDSARGSIRVPLHQQAAAQRSQHSTVPSAPPLAARRGPTGAEAAVRRVGFVAAATPQQGATRAGDGRGAAAPSQRPASQPGSAGAWFTEPPSSSAARVGPKAGGGGSGGGGGAAIGRGRGAGASAGGAKAGRGAAGGGAGTGAAPSAEAAPAASKARRYLDRIEGLKATPPATVVAAEADEWDDVGGASRVAAARDAVAGGARAPSNISAAPAQQDLGAAQEGRAGKGPVARALPVASHTKVKSATFIKSSTALDQCPPARFPEFAVIGRSNVGKSSLINSLTSQHGLAKTSKTPGKIPVP